MALKFSMSRESLSGLPPVPNGIYELQVIGFRPKIAKSGTSLNYNAEFAISNNSQYANNKIFHPLNTAFSVAILDFSHACGLPLEEIEVRSEETGELETRFTLPGTFENADQYPEDPTKWGKYIGPLLGRVFEAEVAITEYQGRQKNEIRAFICHLQDCVTLFPEIRHSANLIKA